MNVEEAVEICKGQGYDVWQFGCLAYIQISFLLQDYIYLLQIFLENCKEPYRQIDKIHLELVRFETIAEALKKSSALFDIQPPDEKNLKQCRRELKLIKVGMLCLKLPS